MHSQDEDGISIRIPSHLVTPGRFKLQFSVELTGSDAQEYSGSTPSQEHPQRSFRTARTSDRPATPYARPEKGNFTKRGDSMPRLAPATPSQQPHLPPNEPPRAMQVAHPPIDTGLASPNATVLSGTPEKDTALGALPPPTSAKPLPFTSSENLRLVAAIRQGRGSSELYPEFSHLSKDLFKVRYSRLRKKVLGGA